MTLEMRLMKDGASARRSWTVPLAPFLLYVSRCQSPRGVERFPSSQLFHVRECRSEKSGVR